MQDRSQYMASLDVDSLFTNIPLVETINICCDLLFRDQPIVDGLNKSELKTLLQLATQESFILFNGSYYKQIDGVAMGSPLGPTLANIFLGYHEEIWLSKCPKEFKPSYYKRYVDDIFVLLPNSSCLEQFKSFMNEQHTNMNFTSESELDNALPFLDVNVSRLNGHFVTSVYRKPTFSGVYTNFSSYIPMTYKLSLVSTLLHRAYTICGAWAQIHSEISQIKSVMRRNGYPPEQIDSSVKNFLNGIHTGKSVKDSEEVEVKKVMISLPYLGSFTKRLQSRIQRSIKEKLPFIHVNFVFRSSSRLRSLFSFKDKIPSHLQSGLVYKFTCGRCNSTYIGETVRHCRARFSEHMGTSALTGASMKRIVPSAVNEHTSKCKHVAVPENFEILCRDNVGRTSRKVKEALFIHRDNPDLNDQMSSVPLVLF